MLAVAPNIMSESKGGHIELSISKHFAKEDVHFVLVGANAGGRMIWQNFMIWDVDCMIKR